MKSHPFNKEFLEHFEERSAGAGHPRHFQAAIKSLRSYPLPIESSAQSQWLNGIGRTFASDFESVLQSKGGLESDSNAENGSMGGSLRPANDAFLGGSLGGNSSSAESTFAVQQAKYKVTTLQDQKDLEKWRQTLRKRVFQVMKNDPTSYISADALQSYGEKLRTGEISLPPTAAEKKTATAKKKTLKKNDSTASNMSVGSSMSNDSQQSHGSLGTEDDWSLQDEGFEWCDDGDPCETDPFDNGNEFGNDAHLFGNQSGTGFHNCNEKIEPRNLTGIGSDDNAVGVGVDFNANFEERQLQRALQASKEQFDDRHNEDRDLELAIEQSLQESSSNDPKRRRLHELGSHLPSLVTDSKGSTFGSTSSTTKNIESSDVGERLRALMGQNPIQNQPAYQNHSMQSGSVTNTTPAIQTESFGSLNSVNSGQPQRSVVDGISKTTSTADLLSRLKGKTCSAKFSTGVSTSSTAPFSNSFGQFGNFTVQAAGQFNNQAGQFSNRSLQFNNSDGQFSSSVEQFSSTAGKIAGQFDNSTATGRQPENSTAQFGNSSTSFNNSTARLGNCIGELGNPPQFNNPMRHIGGQFSNSTRQGGQFMHSFGQPEEFASSNQQSGLSSASSSAEIKPKRKSEPKKRAPKALQSQESNPTSSNFDPIQETTQSTSQQPFQSGLQSQNHSAFQQPFRSGLQGLSDASNVSLSRLTSNSMAVPSSAYMKLLVDTREGRAFGRTELKTVSEQRALPVGDMCWVWNVQSVGASFHTSSGRSSQAAATKSVDQELMAGSLVERKSVPDLSSSLMDGRYTEQKQRLVRLMATSPSKLQIYFLVESAQLPFWERKGGTVSGSGSTGFGMQMASNNFSPIAHTTICSALVHTQFISGIRIVRTVGVEHTHQLLQSMGREIENKRCIENNVIMGNSNFRATPLGTNDAHVATYDEYVNCAKKTGNVTTRQLFGRMLRHVPGCGEEAVEQIVTEFISWIDLCARLPSKTDAEWIKILKANMEVRYEEAGGEAAGNNKPRAIAKTILAKLRMFIDE